MKAQYFQTERAEMVEARELFQVTKHHFNTAPLAVRMLYNLWQKTTGLAVIDSSVHSLEGP